MNIVTMNAPYLHSTAKILFLVRLIRVRQLFFLQITFATKVKNTYGFSTWVPRNTTRKESCMANTRQKSTLSMKASSQSNEKGKPELSAQATNKIVTCQY